jgi:hypothetical protein
MTDRVVAGPAECLAVGVELIVLQVNVFIAVVWAERNLSRLPRLPSIRNGRLSQLVHLLHYQVRMSPISMHILKVHA